ncbi:MULTISPECIES: glycosyltransferase family 2 protein [unclassified Streptomyces]|uniref:glycosyltransferase family 2 protein n=1 Tax=unclassified Streptomyces TaxID=2593676 RepID=UPI00225BB157|nr:MULTISPECIES: glycosyltransferase family 2 protein [unclassified Streptomyces]MCX4524371.1 glycosyltransferase family 2 protein [Streptomyces sp. NBC_01551]MCX4545108.1 glycosyltransferase family 2 protein [Streptomyces sp. NBC_01565]
MTAVHDTDRGSIALSIVVPMFNEEEALPALTARLRPTLDGFGEPYEVLAVDDGSTDRTPRLLDELRSVWPQLRVVTLRRNSGHQAALTAGLHRACGFYVVSLDADLQDPPEAIPDMVATARADGLDIVYGVRTDRSTDSFLKRRTAAVYYWLMRRLVGTFVPAHVGDFRLLSRPVVETLKTLPDQQQVYRLLIPWLGFPSGQITYRRAERVAGTTKYPVRKMVLLALDSITSFSAVPLRLATAIGAFSLVVCLVFFVWTVIVHVTGNTLPGWTSLIITVLFFGAVQLFCLGMLGEYMARVYTAVQARPTYAVARDTDEEQRDSGKG